MEGAQGCLHRRRQRHVSAGLDAQCEAGASCTTERLRQTDVVVAAVSDVTTGETTTTQTDVVVAVAAADTVTMAVTVVMDGVVVGILVAAVAVVGVQGEQVAAVAAAAAAEPLAIGNDPEAEAGRQPEGRGRGHGRGRVRGRGRGQDPLLPERGVEIGSEVRAAEALARIQTETKLWNWEQTGEGGKSGCATSALARFFFKNIY